MNETLQAPPTVDVLQSIKNLKEKLAREELRAMELALAPEQPKAGEPSEPERTPEVAAYVAMLEELKLHSFKYKERRLQPRPDTDVRFRLLARGWYKTYLEGKLELIEESMQTAIIDHLKAEFHRENRSRPRGMYIYGAVGSGKTCMLGVIASLITKWVRNPHDNPPPCYFTSSGKLFELFFERRKDELTKLEDCEILFIDDVGREYGAAYPTSKFENFLEFRYANSLTTFFSSNLKIADLRKRDGWERIADRINDPAWVAHLFLAGESRRVR